MEDLDQLLPLSTCLAQLEAPREEPEELSAQAQSPLDLELTLEAQLEFPPPAMESLGTSRQSQDGQLTMD